LDKQNFSLQTLVDNLSNSQTKIVFQNKKSELKI
jgi:hypothetical protein